MRRAAQLPAGGRTWRDDWATPSWLFRQLDAEFGPFALDAAADVRNAKCRVHFDEGTDGLAQAWHGRVWVNPPYRHIGAWVAKAAKEVAAGRCEVVAMLLPARTGTGWFHNHVLGRAEIRFLRGRLVFEGAKCSAPFDSMVVVWSRTAP